MKRIAIATVTSIAVATALFLLAPGYTMSTEYVTVYKTVPAEEKNHRQAVWIYALEWCESGGRNEAVNPNDKDNTPSYYNFQWKPSTFRAYAEKYEVIPKGLTNAEVAEKMKDYKLQYAVIQAMVDHRSEIRWQNEFPACVKKLGMPPK